jgi:hypothetical protein
VALALPVWAQDDAIPKEQPPPTSEPTEPAPEPTPAEPPPPKKAADLGDPPLHRWGGWTISVAGWEPSLVGADEELAATFQNGIGTEIMGGSTARIRETVALIYHLPKGIGSIGGSYDSMYQNDTIEYLAPGQFIFGETRAFPIVPGVFDDGFADGVSANLLRKTREFRLWYSEPAFESPRAKGTWAVGYRQVSHSRDIAISYLAIVPNLPPIIPPVVPDNYDPNRLKPIADYVTQTSNFTGHGLGVNFDVEFPLHPRFSLISGLSIGLIRGASTSNYVSRTSFYFDDANPGVPLSKDELFTILGAGGEAEILRVAQSVVFVGTYQPPMSQFAQTLDVYFGFQVNIIKGLKVFAALRDVYYANVGQYVVPDADFSNARTNLSAGYEGYVLGLSYRY